MQHGPDSGISIGYVTLDELESAMHTVADFARQRLAPLQSGEPERRRGDVLYQTRA